MEFYHKLVFGGMIFGGLFLGCKVYDFYKENTKSIPQRRVVQGKKRSSLMGVALTDWEGDGDFDFVTFDKYGYRFFENTGERKYTDQGVFKNIPRKDLTALCILVLGDINGDGDLDFVAADPKSTFNYLEGYFSLKDNSFDK